MLIDRGEVPRFGLEALDRIEGCAEIGVFACTNTRIPKRAFRHGLYYFLNLLAVVNAWTRPLPIERTHKRIARTVEFESGYEGAWQTLPEEIVNELNGYDLVLKLGMGLMRVPPGDRLRVPVLSYHHGDPDKYRGRPAGFWEMVEGEPVMGQIVQIIGNRLDAGEVVAYAETKVLPWSWRATLIESYRHSPLIINEAVRNALSGRRLPKPRTGRNWRLPSNGQVAAFVLRMAARFARRLIYGAVMEKRWRVSIAPWPEAAAGLLEGRAFPPPARWRTLPVPKPYLFYADPFFCREGVLVEALRAGTGRGEIVLVRGDEHRCVLAGRGHMSYPATVEVGGRELVLPEIAGWSPPKAFRLADGRLNEAAPLAVEGEPRIVDPTLSVRDGRFYLFGNVRSLGSNVLCLWSAEALDATFRPHPLSPIRISPKGARMAGALLEEGGRLIRLGQDFRFGYGDGVFAFEVERLTPDDYAERPIGKLRFGDRRGPHTLNVRGGEIVFDWYRDRVSLLAGVRRLLGRSGG